VYKYTGMTVKSALAVENELREFTSRNFMRPSECRNLGQIRFYIRELGEKIQELELAGHYVPTWVYQLLSQYNARENALTWPDQRRSRH
jgi:hypothetical protein